MPYETVIVLDLAPPRGCSHEIDWQAMSNYSQRAYGLAFQKASMNRAALVLLCVCAAFGQEKELKDAAGNTIIRYVLETPRGMAPAGTKDPAKQVGLFLCFAEHERPTGDELLPVRESLRRQGLSDQFVLLAGHSQALKMSLADHEPIRKLTEWALQNFPIN